MARLAPHPFITNLGDFTDGWRTDRNDDLSPNRNRLDHGEPEVLTYPKFLAFGRQGFFHLELDFSASAENIVGRRSDSECRRLNLSMCRR
ncbi:hypothetical protein A0J57_10500 [Sphingobium sp. 22B]|nr:hypothetical protein A0J57_10500 [Sphingobium sp. 22B]OAP31980.1 hypothetical protein A8O16_10295 [Sphingobium sp. 20006FA]